MFSAYETLCSWVFRCRFAERYSPNDFTERFPGITSAIEADSYLEFPVLALADGKTVVISGMEEIPIEEQKESSLFANHHSQGCNPVRASVAVSPDRLGRNEFTFGRVIARLSKNRNASRGGVAENVAAVSPGAMFVTLGVSCNTSRDRSSKCTSSLEVEAP